MTEGIRAIANTLRMSHNSRTDSEQKSKDLEAKEALMRRQVRAMDDVINAAFKSHNFAQEAEESKKELMSSSQVVPASVDKSSKVGQAALS